MLKPFSPSPVRLATNAFCRGDGSVSFHAAAAIVLCAALTACSRPAPVVSADTSCVRFRHIDVTPWQVDDMKKDPNQWRSLALQILGHNQEYDKACVHGDK